MPRRSRRSLVLAAAVLWLVGVELGPNLHLALHDHLAPHTHLGESIAFAHRHADGTIHRAARPNRRRTPSDLAVQLEHGAHALAHHATGVVPTAPTLVVALPVDRRPTLVVAAASAPLASLPSARATARGPPAPAST